MIQIVNGKVYNTETATLLASDHYWDGHNHDRQGRNTYLYKTKKGAFFVYHTTMWQDERNGIEVLSEGQAKELYETLPADRVPYVEAFGVEPEEA